MRRTTFAHALVLAAAAAGLPVGTAVAQASAPEARPAPAGLSAAAACERAARQAAHPVIVTFTAAPAVQADLSNESQTVLRGAGRWQTANGMRTFSYTCTVDPRNPESVGLAIRDSTPASTAKAPPARAPIEPDLSALSPDACESSAVAALQQRWPRVSAISFDPATRSFRQPTASTAELHGSGRALPGPGAPSTVFEFNCAIDPRDGRILHIAVKG